MNRPGSVMDRDFKKQKSILRTSGAGPGPGEGARRVNSVHYKRESKLLEIIPPREISSSSSHQTNAGIEGRGGIGNTSGRVQELIKEAVIDFDTLSDDSTPLAETLQDRLDYSVVFGAVQGKYNENEEFEDESGGGHPPGIPGKNQTKEQQKKTREPDHRIKLFAFRLALIEKAASALGTIAFLWATVVILGGFASTVTLTDFLVVTMIILAETSRIFSRSHELEWQHVSSKSSAGVVGLKSIINTFRSLSRQSNALDSKPFRKASLIPGRFSPDNRSRSPTSPDSDLRTPTNSSSTSSRHNRKVAAAAAAAAAATAPPPSSAPLPRPNSELTELTELAKPWAGRNVAVVPFFNDVLTADLVGRILYFAQLVSAVVTIGLSFWRLADQNFYKKDSGNAPPSAPAPSPIGRMMPTSMPNVDVSMNVFYILAVLEGGLFLFERSYWEYRIRYKKLLSNVCDEDHVGSENTEIVKQFFYDVYAESLKGSVFDGLEMHLVQYSIKWLQTEDFKQQLAGARLLNRFVSKGNKFREKDRFAQNALRSLGTTPGIIERLVEMLSWGSRHEEMLLREVSSIICRLVRYNRNCARFVAVPGAMDGVVSLLFPYGTNSSAPILGHRNRVTPFYLRLMGLRILKYLCKDHKNSLKIGETRGLLSILMVFIEVRGANTFKVHPPDSAEGSAMKDLFKTYKKSLQVILLLAGATNTSGGILRKRMAAIVSGLKNMRDILEFGSTRPELQRLSIEILYHLAMEDDVRQMIGSTGGVIRKLFQLFSEYELWSEEGPEEDKRVKKIREERKLAAEKAGDTLTRLVLQNQENCERLLELKDENKEKILVKVMVGCVSSKDEKIASSAAQILRSVMKYADDSTKAEVARQTATDVVTKIFVVKGQFTKSEMYEASLGLAARILDPLDSEMYLYILKTVNKTEFVEQLMRNLHHTPTTNKYPRIRRFSVELIIAMMAKDDSFLESFRRHNLDLKSELEKTLDSTSEVENFCLFSGLVGYTLFFEKIESLVRRAMAAVDNYYARTTTAEAPDPLAT